MALRWKAVRLVRIDGAERREVEHDGGGEGRHSGKGLALKIIGWIAAGRLSGMMSPTDHAEGKWISASLAASHAG